MFCIKVLYVFDGISFSKILNPLFLKMFLIAVLLAILPVNLMSLWYASNLGIEIGVIILLYFFKAFKYSIPKILLGEERIFTYFRISFKYIINAFSRAFGKDIPLCNSCDNKFLYSLGSLYKTVAILSKISILEVSAPKEI